MARIRPVTFIWTRDGAMVPLPRFRKQCFEQFVIDEEYPLGMISVRSRASHSHYFACITEGWLNLPERIAKDYPSEEHLRKKALIHTGWCTEKTLVCESEEFAAALAALSDDDDEYVVIQVDGNVVRKFKAKSQNASSMNGEDFQKSKTAVLDWISDLIGIRTSELARRGDERFKREPKRRG